jgi:hypothetical protein
MAVGPAAQSGAVRGKYTARCKNLQSASLACPGRLAPVIYLTFDRSEGADGVTTLEALATTRADRHAEVMHEVDTVLAWARALFPHSHGPIEDGNDWDHDLQVVVEGGQWHAVSLTFTGTPHFIDELLAAFAGDNGQT